MLNQDVYNISVAFRAAILEAKHRREFDGRDRMSHYPYGCCDDTCDLLAHYLNTAYGIYTKQRNGVYRDNNPYNTTNHVWLVMENGEIIDLTADQFDFLPKIPEGVYVGKETSFYVHLDRIRTDDNYNITQSERLWNDYHIIMTHMVK